MPASPAATSFGSNASRPTTVPGCASDGTPCAKGLLCVQLDPPGFCVERYTGVCMEQPKSCAGVAKLSVCGCNGYQYDNVCEARKAGYARAFVACDPGSG